MKKRFIALLLALFSIIYCQTTYHVKTDGNDSNDGLSWANAKSTIQSALTASSQDRTQTREFNFITSSFSSIDDVDRHSVPVVTDLDGNGLFDLVIGEENGKLFVYEQVSVNSSSFVAQTPPYLQTSASLNIDVGSYSAPCFYDIDGDNLLDLLVGRLEDEIAHYEQSSVNARTFNLVTNSFSGISFTDQIYYLKPSITDLDGDGFLDLLLGKAGHVEEPQNGRISHYEQSSSNSYNFSATALTDYFNDIDVGDWASPTITDFFSDGILDLLIGERYDNINYYKQSSSNSTTFSLVDSDFIPDVPNPSYSAPVVFDIDGDNLLDMLIGDQDGGIYHYEAILTIESQTVSIGAFSAEISTSTLIDGTGTMTARGICWSTSSNPTLADSYTSEALGIGEFNSDITGLSKATKYYARGYCTNNGTTTYGSQISFTTDDIPVVGTNPIDNITHESADGGGEVLEENGSNVTTRGVCWSTISNPTINDSKTSNGSGTGTFTSSITGLSVNTTYYVRAYATNEAGTGYGDNVTFTTDNIPTVTTDDVSNILYNEASGGGNVTNDGNANVSARGVCWSIASNPTLDDGFTTDGSGTGSFSSSITGLNPATAYYVRAYATNEAGTAYGNEKSFTSSNWKPNVVTNSIGNLSPTSAKGIGTVIYDNGEAVTSRGICYSTNSNPTTDDNAILSGTGEGEFTVNMTGLTEDTRYYAKAFATNSLGTTYGDEIEFSTPYQLSNMLDFTSSSNQYITTDLTLPNNGTIEFWVKMDDLSTHGMVDAGSASSTWRITYSGNYNYYCSIGNSSVIVADYTTTNKWHHVAATWSKNSYSGTVTYSFYLDGILQDALYENTWEDPESTINIGCYYSNNGFFNGQMEEFRIWDRILSGAEILNNMYNSVDPNSQNLICYYNFDQSSGSSVDDLSSSENDGTLHNFADTDWKVSTAPIGDLGLPVRTNIQTTIGNSGKQLSATISNPNPAGIDSYLGIYASGDGSDTIDAETFPENVYFRADIIWGVEETGNVTADLIIDYSNVSSVSSPNAVILLKRADSTSGWQDVTSDFTHDSNNHTFSKTGVTSFSEFSIGDADDNALPVTLSEFTSNFLDGIAVLNWTTQSESNNLGWNIYRSTSQNLDQAEKINNELFPGAVTTSEMTEYSYEDDSEFTPLTTYWYWLESVAADGETDMYDPVTLTTPEDLDDPQTPDIPTEFGLYDNYPNPFNPDTRISFALQETGHCILNIYNIKGELVRKLYNAPVEKNRIYNLIWDGRDDSGKKTQSGLYFYQLKAGKHEYTKKMLMLK